jgi:DNA-directed RNA polymerase specialized sigma24 family protein
MELLEGAIGLCETEDGMQDIGSTAVYIGNYLHRTFPMVDRQDIVQEIMVWVAGHEEKILQWAEEGEHGAGKLHKSMRHAGLKYCQDEKAAILGYRPEDVYYYELGLIKDTLTRIWDEEAWTSPPQPSDQTKVKHRAVSEGNNYAATLCDVSRVVSQLEDGERNLLELHFRDGYSLSEIGDLADTTRAAIEGRITRLIKKLQRMLGGERPNVRD